MSNVSDYCRTCGNLQEECVCGKCKKIQLSNNSNTCIGCEYFNNPNNHCKYTTDPMLCKLSSSYKPT